MKRLLILAVAVALTACGQPPNRVSDTPLTAERIETPRYLGVWHEAARLPNRFEHDCVGATAEYAQRGDGLISVTNTCTRADGTTRQAIGRARPASAEGEGKLKVSFFGPFWADYWVIARADDYSWSLVSEPEGRYLWVLTRAPQISPQQRAEFEGRLRELGYDVTKLVWNER